MEIIYMRGEAVTHLEVGFPSPIGGRILAQRIEEAIENAGLSNLSYSKGHIAYKSGSEPNSIVSEYVGTVRIVRAVDKETHYLIAYINPNDTYTELKFEAKSKKTDREPDGDHDGGHPGVYSLVYTDPALPCIKEPFERLVRSLYSQLGVAQSIS